MTIEEKAAWIEKAKCMLERGLDEVKTSKVMGCLSTAEFRRKKAIIENDLKKENKDDN